MMHPIKYFTLFKENHVNPRHFHEIDFRESYVGWIAARTGLPYFQQRTSKKTNPALETRYFWSNVLLQLLLLNLKFIPNKII